MCCGLSTACEVFLIFTTRQNQYVSVLFLFALVSDEPEVFLPKYSETGNTSCCSLPEGSKYTFRWHVRNIKQNKRKWLETVPFHNSRP